MIKTLKPIITLKKLAFDFQITLYIYYIYLNDIYLHVSDVG